MLYLVPLDVRQTDGRLISEYKESWRRNVAARGLHNGGTLQGFKVVGKQTIFAIAEFPNNEALDKALSGLPIVEELGDAVEIEVIPVRPYGEVDLTAEITVTMGEGLDLEADVDGEPGLKDTCQTAR